MSKFKQGVRNFPRIFTLIFSLFLVSNNQLYAKDSTASDATIIPASEPFSLDGRSAVYCINLLKNNRFMEKNGSSGRYKIVEVQTVCSWFIEHDKSYPEGHRNRYNIIVNSKPLDWDNSYIEYGREMVNLQLLFLYRNQHPPESLEYYSVK
ncbi:MAG: hypothetical protein RBT69_10880 [Spirochaetia bacterium]|jgi:hypothetical protein|nr:hypothetical protein [Spirochaetia bacterium]